MAEIEAVTVIGPFRGVTGYDHHVRAFVRGLVATGIAVQLRQHAAWGDHPGSEGVLDPFFAELARPVPARLSLQFCMPHQIGTEPDLPILLHTMFEATRIPQSWVEASRRVRLTLLPTESSRRAWQRSGVPSGCLRLSPLGVDPAFFGARHEPLPIVLADGRPLASVRHRFLNVSTWTPRKNLEGLAGAWLAATSHRDDAVLVMKVMLSPGFGLEALRAFLDLLARSSGRALADAAPIHVIADILSDEEMARLYAAATHYLSLSHGEGWDLPMMEACAAGLVPIAPDHSAYRDYLSPADALLIPSKVAASGLDRTDSLFSGLDWWQPDRASAVRTIRAILDDGLAPPRLPRDRILRNFTWERAVSRLIAILDEAAVDPVGDRRRRWWPGRRTGR